MNTELVSKLMELTPGFQGVFPCDHLPNAEPFTSFIVNTDPSAEPGDHWIAIYISEKTLYFFDSFGRKIDDFKDPFKSYMKRFSKNFNVRTDSKLLQFFLSNSCGYWCIYYIYCKFCNVRFMFKIFSNNNLKNEKILYDTMNFIFTL